MKKPRIKISLSLILSCILAFLGGCLPKEESPIPVIDGTTLTAEFLDVGQGDCSLFFLPDGKVLLVDAANPGDGDEIVEYLKSKKIKKIDYLVATHPHADHIGGMAEVINSFEIGQIFAPKINEGDVPTTKTYENFLTAVKDNGLKITSAKTGLTMFSTENYKAECLSPAGTERENLNNYSIVFKLTFGVHSFLLTGDAEKDIEEQILKSKANVDCDVLKVAHHGSDSSSSKKYLKAVSPKIAVISCGADNSYGHPHKEPLERLKKTKGIENIFRTDLDKTVIIKSNGKDSLTFTKNNKTVIGD